MKKVALIISVIFIVTIFATVSLAGGVNGDYKGNPIVNVVINGVKLTGLDVPAISFNNRTLLPLRACIESVNGIVGWDDKTQTAFVLKPEVNIYFITLSEDGNSVNDVYPDAPVLAPGGKFYSIVNISDIPKGSYTAKVEIVDQNGNAVVESSDNAVNIEADGDTATISTEYSSDDLQFTEGTYKFKVYMKDTAGNYKPVAVKSMKYIKQ